MSFIVFILCTHKFQGSAYSFEEKSFFLVSLKKTLNLLINLKKEEQFKVLNCTGWLLESTCIDALTSFLNTSQAKTVPY